MDKYSRRELFEERNPNVPVPEYLREDSECGRCGKGFFRAGDRNYLNSYPAPLCRLCHKILANLEKTKDLEIVGDEDNL